MTFAHRGTNVEFGEMGTEAEVQSERTNITMTTKPKKKRLNHNELERKRRHHQREVLYELRDIIPTLHMVKPSTVLIMQKAKEYIDLLRRTIQEMEIEINDLRRALIAAGYPLPMPPNPQMLCGIAGGHTVFGSSCQSPVLMQEPILNVPQLPIDQTFNLQNLGCDSNSITQSGLEPHDIESINRLHAVFSKTSDISINNPRPLSPVSPYQLDPIQDCSSGEFKKHTVTISSAGQAVLGTHA